MKPFALARVLQLAERHSETLSRQVKQAHGEWLRARGRLVQLQALRDAHRARDALDLRDGVAATRLHAMHRLQHEQAAERQVAQAAIDSTWQLWQTRLADWMQAEQRVKAYRLLRERHLTQIALQQKHSEQRQHDELVALAHMRVR